MTGVLNRIVEDKKQYVAQCKAMRSIEDVESLAQQTDAPLGFARALRSKKDAGRPGLIAEIKRASPSAGLIRPDFDPAELAMAYARGGAACLSVLTDQPYFQGQDSFVLEAKQASRLPVLRKDFIIDPYQVAEARMIGADAILLIMAILEDAMAAELLALAKDWHLDALVEVHDGDELDRALALDAPLIGINNRNLDTLAVDLNTGITLKARIPDDRLLVAESGFQSAPDLARYRQAGIHCFLVGEHLMRQSDVTAATKALLEWPA